MGIRSAVQRQNQFRHFRPELSECSVSHAFGICAPRRQHVQDYPAALADDVGSHGAKLDIHGLQQPRDAVDGPIAVLASMRSFLHPCRARTVAGFTGISWKPYFGRSSIFHTGIQYTPVDSMATCLILCSFSQAAFQLPCKSGEPFFQNPGFGFAADPRPDTHTDGLFVNIQTGATAVK
jgi:hypothetical protein